MAAGIAVAGIAIKGGIKEFHTADRYVTVKGLSERDVKADTASYNLTFSLSGNDLQETYNKLAQDAKLVKSFFAENSITEDEIQSYDITSQDNFRGSYAKSELDKENRYVVYGSYSLKTADVYKAKKLKQASSGLIEKGINIDSSYVAYYFTKINDIKPDMISEAIAAARKSAERFAQDSQSELSGIRRANQGSVSIRDVGEDYSDTAAIDKKVRIVSTVIYNLKD